MMRDADAFDTATPEALSPTLAPTHGEPVGGTTDDAASKAAQDRRDQDKVLALMLCGVVALVLAVWLKGGYGFLGWGLTMTGLAGVWVIYTTRGIRTSADD